MFIKKKAECVGYSEIDKHAIEEYQMHFPSHKNLGDITQIKKKDIDKLGKIDLVVAGFPCNDLSSLKKNRQGLHGESSGLFWKLKDILKWINRNNKNLSIIIENNVSMSMYWRDKITNELKTVFRKPVYCNYFDSCQWVVQRRRRYYWTLQEIPLYTDGKIQNMDNVLLSVDELVKNYNKSNHKLNPIFINDKEIDYLNTSPFHNHGKKGEIIIKKGQNKLCVSKRHVPYSTRLTLRSSSTTDNYIKSVDTSRQFLLDYRLCKHPDRFIPRYYEKLELNRLFGFPDNFIKTNKKTIYSKLYGKSVIPPVIIHIILSLNI